MTVQEAHEYLEDFQRIMTQHREAYSKKLIEANGQAILALEKQIPKKPRVDDDSWLCCPNCDETFAMFDNLNRRLLCCGCCGQKLDWSEVDAKKRSDTE